jgi:dephospho-CoA kinase
MLKVALTGGIATGKSYVLAKLRDRGVPTIDADAIVHEALGRATPTTKAIATQFGSVFIKPDGSIDRALLGTKVFRDADARLTLEAIIHPVVYEEIQRWFDGLDRPMGVASIPLLFETHREGDFDYIVVTECAPEQQIQRLIERDRLDRQQAEQRLAAQLPTEQKVKHADFVIQTGGTMPATDRQVEQLLIDLSAKLTTNN